MHSLLLLLAIFGAEGQVDPYGFVGITSGKIDGAIEQFSSAHDGANAATAFAQCRGDIMDRFEDLFKNANTMSMESPASLGHGLRVTGIISGIINDVKKGIESAIDYAAVVAKDILSATIDEIKSKIIDEIGRQVQDILGKFFNGVSQLLDQFWNLIEKTNCAVISGNVDKIIQFLNDLGKGCSFLDACCRKSGYYVPTSLHSIISEAPSKLYDVELCRRQADLSEKSSKEELSKAYVDSQILAKKYYCVNYGSSTARDHFGQEYTRWGSKYFLWQKAVDSGCLDAASCYHTTLGSLNNALSTVPLMIPRSTVDSAAANISATLRNAAKWCDCYIEQLSPDTGTCPKGECEWARCSKVGYFAKGYLFTDIHDHDSYGLTTNGYSSSFGGPLECCKPCYSLSPTSSYENKVQEATTVHGGCASGDACYNEASAAVKSARGSSESMAGKQDVANMMASVQTSLARGIQSCDCYYEDMGSDTHTCSNGMCAWARCSNEGYFPVGYLFTDIHDHDSYGLAPPGYSSSFKSVHCCKPCIQNGVAKHVKLVDRAQSTDPHATDCQNALECYELAIDMLFKGVLELQAKASKSDLDSALTSLQRGLSQASWSGTDAHGTDNMGTDTHACSALCVWAACSQTGHFITGLLWTDIHGHDSLGKTVNGYSPSLKPIMCASPAFTIKDDHRQSKVQEEVIALV